MDFSSSHVQQDTPDTLSRFAPLSKQQRCGSSGRRGDATFSFGAKNKLRNRSPIASFFQTRPCLSETPELFGPKQNGTSSQPTPTFSFGLGSAARQPEQEQETPEAPSCLSSALNNPRILLLIAQHLYLEIHEAKRLALVSKRWNAVSNQFPIENLDFTKAQTASYSDSLQTVDHITAALQSLTGELSTRLW